MKEESIQYFNSVEAAKILGVNVSTIKRWTETDRLHCVRTPGGHRKFLPVHLSQFLEQSQKKKRPISFLQIEEADDVEITAHIFNQNLPFLHDYIFSRALTGNIDQVLFALSGLIIASMSLVEIYDTIITPVLYRLGDYWEQEKISSIQEHLASQTIRQAICRLQAIITIPRKKIGAVLCLNLPNELHDIPLQMVGNVLEKRGFRVLFSGQMTPYLGLEEMLNHLTFNRIYISITIVQDPVTIRRELTQICQLAARKAIQVFVGGQGVKLLNMELPENTKQLYNFSEVFDT